MAGLEVRGFDAPDETHKPDKSQADVVRMGANNAARLTLEPGWMVGVHQTRRRDELSGEARGRRASGRLHVSDEDGTESEIGRGEAYVIEPGHDAWVIGDEPFVAYEFESTTADVCAKS